MSIQLYESSVMRCGLMVLGAVLVLAGILALALTPWQTEVTVRMAIPGWTRSTPFYVAMDKGFFRRENLRVEMTFPVTGRSSIEMLATGQADIASAASPPVIDMLRNGQPLWILSALSLSDRCVGLVAPAAIERFNQLPGKRIAVTRGSTSELFIRAMLQSAGVRLTDVTFVYLQQKDMADALANSQIDVASTVETFRMQNIAALPGAHILYADGTFLDYALLVASPDFVRSQPQAVRKVLSALVQAIAYIQQHPEESQRIALRYVPSLQHPWNMHDFSLRLDNVLADALTTNARLLYGDRQALPDFQHSFYYQGLHSLLPAAVVGARREGDK